MPSDFSHLTVGRDSSHRTVVSEFSYLVPPRGPQPSPPSAPFLLLKLQEAETGILSKIDEYRSVAMRKAGGSSRQSEIE